MKCTGAPEHASNTPDVLLPALGHPAKLAYVVISLVKSWFVDGSIFVGSTEHIVVKCLFDVSTYTFESSTWNYCTLIYISRQRLDCECEVWPNWRSPLDRSYLSPILWLSFWINSTSSTTINIGVVIASAATALHLVMPNSWSIQRKCSRASWRKMPEQSLCVQGFVLSNESLLLPH